MRLLRKPIATNARPVLPYLKATGQSLRILLGTVVKVINVDAFRPIMASKHERSPEGTGDPQEESIEHKRKVLQVRVKRNEWNEYLKMFFARWDIFLCQCDPFVDIGEKNFVPNPTTDANLGDIVLIVPVNQRKKLKREITYQVLRVIERYGDARCPITNRKVLEGEFDEMWQMRSKIVRDIYGNINPLRLSNNTPPPAAGDDSSKK